MLTSERFMLALVAMLPSDTRAELDADLAQAEPVPGSAPAYSFELEDETPIPCPEAPDYLLASATYTGWSFDTAEIDTGLAA